MYTYHLYIWKLDEREFFTLLGLSMMHVAYVIFAHT